MIKIKKSKCTYAIAYVFPVMLIKNFSVNNNYLYIFY